MGNIFIWVVVCVDKFGQLECVGFGSEMLATNYVATHTNADTSFYIREILAEDVEVE